MKMIVAVALALVAVVAAAPVEEEPVQIVRSDYNTQPDGAFEWSFEAANGIQQQATGEVKQVVDEENKPQTVVVIRGSYSYPGADGNPISVTYTADETGFHAEGDSIPKPARR